MATEAKRCVLDNQNCPALPSMSEMDVADAAGFLEEILLCLPVLGINEFKKPQTEALREKKRLFLKGPDCQAEGMESTDGFVVFKGARARMVETSSIHKFMTEARKSLLSREILEENGTQFILKQDYTFSSPTTAAGVFWQEMLMAELNGRMRRERH